MKRSSFQLLSITVHFIACRLAGSVVHCVYMRGGR